MANHITETEILNPSVITRSYVVRYSGDDGRCTQYYYCGTCKKSHKVTDILMKDSEVYETHCPLCGAKHDLHIESGFELYAKSKTVFADTGNVNYHVYYRTVKFAWTKKQFYPANDSYTVILKKDSGKAVVKFNNKHLEAANACVDVNTIIKTVAKQFPNELPFSNFEGFRKYNNPRLVDLHKFVPDCSNFTHNFYSTLTPNERRRIFYAMDKHGSKGAFKAIAPTINSKVIRSFLWELKADPFNAHPVLRLLHRGFTISQVEGLINAHKKFSTVNSISYVLIHTYLVLGMTPTKAINFYEKFGTDREKNHYLTDTARMVQALGGNYVLPVHYSHPNLHNIVLRDYLAMTEKGKKNVEFKVPKVVFDWTYDGYVIKRVSSSKELRFVGSHMSHCVGSYEHLIINERCQIYVLYKEGDLENPLVCIEVKNGNQVNQAKLQRNKSVSTDPILHSVVSSWIKEFSVLKYALDLIDMATYY